MQDLCKCAKPDEVIRNFTARDLVVERVVREVTNVHAAFLTKLFSEKSTPYAKRNES